MGKTNRKDDKLYKKMIDDVWTAFIVRRYSNHHILFSCILLVQTKSQISKNYLKQVLALKTLFKLDTGGPNVHFIVRSNKVCPFKVHQVKVLGIFFRKETFLFLFICQCWKMTIGSSEYIHDQENWKYFAIPWNCTISDSK